MCLEERHGGEVTKKVKYSNTGKAVQVEERVWEVEGTKIHGVCFRMGKNYTPREIKPGYRMTMWSGVRLTKPAGFSFIADFPESMRQKGLQYVSWSVVPERSELGGTIEVTLRNPPEAQSPVVVNAGDELIVLWQVPAAIHDKACRLLANAHSLPDEPSDKPSDNSGVDTYTRTIAEMQKEMKKMQQEIKQLKEEVLRLNWK